jgi:hypothetical protein
MSRQLPIGEVSAPRFDVCSVGHSRRELLTLSFSHFDPKLPQKATAGAIYLHSRRIGSSNHAHFEQSLATPFGDATTKVSLDLRFRDSKWNKARRHSDLSSNQV